MIDSRIEEKLRDRFLRREDFSELKSIVQELAEAQRRTEIQVQSLARNVGRLSDNVGFGLEDIARVVLP
jgi:hypothetical protein